MKEQQFLFGVLLLITIVLAVLAAFSHPLWLIPCFIFAFIARCVSGEWKK
jgi:hypothetical protein